MLFGSLGCSIDVAWATREKTIEKRGCGEPPCSYSPILYDVYGPNHL